MVVTYARPLLNDRGLCLESDISEIFALMFVTSARGHYHGHPLETVTVDYSKDGHQCIEATSCHINVELLNDAMMGWRAEV